MTIGRPPKIFQAGSNKGESSATFHAESQSLNLGRRIEFLFTGCYLSRSLLRPIENARQRLCKSHSAPGATPFRQLPRVKVERDENYESEKNQSSHRMATTSTSPRGDQEHLALTAARTCDEKINLLLGRRGILSFSDH